MGSIPVAPGAHPDKEIVHARRTRPSRLAACAWAATQEGDPRFHGRPVVSISGDGGFGQYMAELTTAVKYSMNITHVLLNNGELAKISKEQRSADYDV